MNNKEIWDKLKTPPPEALKKIKGGRLSGMSDISPQWRYEIMTEVFGPCGVGWNFQIERMWTEKGSEDQVFAFAEIHLAYKNGETWSTPVPGVGGSMLVAKEKAGLHSSDEAFKMAITDAIGTAMKMIGVAADVYAGKCDDRKNSKQPQNDNQQGNNNEFGF